MSDTITILNVNPAIVLEEVIAAIKDGYSLSLCMQGQVLENSLIEVTLFKDPQQPVPTTATIAEVVKKKLYNISDYDSLAFLSGIQWAVKQNYDIDLNSLFWSNIKAVDVIPPQKKAKKEKDPTNTQEQSE